MERLKVIAFTHKSVGLEDIGRLHIEDTARAARLTHLKEALDMDELLYLNTCNRTEFIVVTHTNPEISWLAQFFHAFNPNWTVEEVKWAVDKAIVLEDEDAFRHLLEVASSVDSLVVGEREIITQVRNAYESCLNWQLTGDLIRLVIRKTIETAKQIYTQTSISRNPVSIVSLAYRKLKSLNVKLDARFVIIGSGVTNTAMARYLKKHGFKNFTLFNRTVVNARSLAHELNAEAFPLTDLPQFKKGFDVLISCTAATHHTVSLDLYTHLLNGDNNRKIIIDLANPADIDPAIVTQHHVQYIDIQTLQEIAQSNLKEREQELDICRGIINENVTDFHFILQERKVELAMSEVPQKVKEIKQTALNTVFSKEIDTLDENSREVLNKVISYMEKKYISMPIKMAKEILLKK